MILAASAYKKSANSYCFDSFWCAHGEGGGRDFAPAADSLSFTSPKESKPRKSDPTDCVPSLRCGQPAVLAPSGVSLELASLRQSRALIRWPLRSSAPPEGNPKTRQHTGHCFARPTPLGRKRHALRRLDRAKQWPAGCLAAPPFWLRLRRGVCGVACASERACLRQLTRRGCPSGAPQAQSEFHGAPRKRPDAGLPRRGRRLQGRLSFAYFSLAKQRKVSRPPGRDPAPALSTDTDTDTDTDTTAKTYRKLTQKSPPAQSPPRAKPGTTPAPPGRRPACH